jgi:predicted RNA-binding protein YlqC (UPF0109 family)
VSDNSPGGFAFTPPDLPAVDEDADDFEDAEDFEDEGFEQASSADGANRLDGGTARSVLEHLARSIVDEPEAVVIETGEARGVQRLSLHVAPGDMGRVIGKRGRVAQAIRTVVRAAAARDGADASVDIVD